MMPDKPTTAINSIAVDGPAASGKSTLAAFLAEKLGYLYFDTGVMYRAVTLAALERNIPVDSIDDVEKIARTVSIDVRPPSVKDHRRCDVLLDGKDITWEIRAPIVDANVSQVSTYPGVRNAMTHRQREIGLRGRVVMVGRDIGTVVMPEADLKIYLDASTVERARRRLLECDQQGGNQTYEEILRSMQARDRLDSTRDLAPLKPADDAIIIDTTNMGIDEVLERGYALALGAPDGNPASEI